MKVVEIRAAFDYVAGCWAIEIINEKGVIEVEYQARGDALGRTLNTVATALLDGGRLLVRSPELTPHR